MDVTQAYRECERITWRRRRNFAYGIRLLPPAKRRALTAIYAFARRIDDIGDGTLPAAAKLAALQDARGAVLALSEAGSRDPGAGDPVPDRACRRGWALPRAHAGLRRDHRWLRGRHQRHELQDV